MMALNISAGTLGALQRSLTARKPAVFSTAGALKRYSGASSHHSCAVETDTRKHRMRWLGLAASGWDFQETLGSYCHQVVARSPLRRRG